MSISRRFIARFGLDNGNNTITGIGSNNSTLSLAGNLTTSGAFATTLTATATTNLTLPTSGTLATLAGTESLTNKTVNGLTITSTTGTLTLASGSTLATAGAFSTTLTATGATNVTLPTSGTLATLDGTETFTNKTLTAPDINGGTADSLTSLSIRDTSAAFDVTVAATSSTALTAGRTVTIDVVNGARTVKLGGNLDLGANFTTTTGAVTLAGQAGGSSVTLPASGTLSTLDGAETLTNKTLTTPTINGAALSGTLSGTATLSGAITFSNGTTNFNAGSAGGTVNLATDVTSGTANIFAGVTGTINVGAATSTVVIPGNLTVQGTTTTVNSTTVTVSDKNLELGSVTTPTDTTANGGGITLKGATDKSITWDSANSNWTSSEHWNLASGKVFKINNTEVLSGSALGSGVTGSSLTSVGTLTSGTWNATTIGVAYGGTGLTSAPSNGQLLIGNGTGYTLATLTQGSGISITSASGSITIANDDKGSSQNIFKNIAVSGQSTIVADSNNDTITLVAGSGVSITTDADTDTITVGISGGGGSADAAASSLVSRDANGATKFTTVALVDSTTTSSTVVTELDGTAASIANSSAQTAIDTFATASYRSAHYTVQVSDGTDFQITHLLVLWKGSDAYVTEYGQTYSSANPIATLDADVSGGNVRLLATNASGSGTYTYKIMRNTFAA